MKSKPPPPLPRAAFIAALAAAGAFSTLKLKRRAPAASFRLERRDRSIRHIARHLGRAIIAAGAAQQRFDESGKAWTPPAPEIDPRVRAIAACPAFVRALGRPSHCDDGDAPCWVEVRAEPPRVQIFWRGAFSDDREAFARAVAAAIAALNAAGYPTTHFLDVRKHKVGAEHHEPGAAFSFEGLVATIGLRRSTEPAR